MSLKAPITIDKLLDKRSLGPRTALGEAEDGTAQGELRPKTHLAGKWQTKESETTVNAALGALHVAQEDRPRIRGGSVSADQPHGYSSSHFLPTERLDRDLTLTASGLHNDNASDGAFAAVAAVAANAAGDMIASEVPASSDWRMLPSGSFDETYAETYFECAYNSHDGELAPATGTDTDSHFDDTMMNALESDGGSHELPVSTTAHLGSSWILSHGVGGMKNTTATPTSGFMLPVSTSLTSMMSSSSTGSMLEGTGGFSSAGFAYGGADFDDKQPSGVPSCPSDLPSPVHMETFVPFLTHPSEPPELLFEDMSYWSSAAAQPSLDVYDQRYDQYYHHHSQQDHTSHAYNVLSSRVTTLPHGYLCFEDPGANAAGPAANLRGQAGDCQYSPLHPSVPAPAPSTFRLLQGHEQTSCGARWSTDAHQQYVATPPAKSMGALEVTGNETQSRNSGEASSSVQCKREIQLERPASKRTLRSLALRSSTLRSSTMNLRSSPATRQSCAGSSASMAATKTSPPDDSPPSLLSSQSAQIRLLTALNNCYWKNGRKNLQCFPSCPEHRDFYSMKMSNRKHSSVGVCRGPVYCHAFTDASKLELSRSTATVVANVTPETLAGFKTSRQMKYEHGVGATSSGGSAQELFVLGRFERVPQHDDTNLLKELRAPPRFPNAATFEEFRYSCFQAVEMEERRVLLPSTDAFTPSEDADGDAGAGAKAPSAAAATDKQRVMRSTWFFLPDVWKVQPMLKKKRKATRSTPAQTFPFCFRVFIYTHNGNSSKGSSSNATGYTCLADSASSFFELYSTRTVDRVKRKYWGGGSPSGGAAKRQDHGFKRL